MNMETLIKETADKNYGLSEQRISKAKYKVL